MVNGVRPPKLQLTEAPHLPYCTTELYELSIQAACISWGQVQQCSY